MPTPVLVRLFAFFCLFVGVFSATAQPFKYYGVSKETETGSIGLQIGSGVITGDMAYKPFVQGGLYYQYAFQRWMSGRLYVGYGRYYGADTEYTTAIQPNKVLNGEIDPKLDYTDIGRVYQNYQTDVLDFSLQVKFNLIEIFSPSYKGALSVYALGGIGALSNVTKTDLLDAQGNKYPYNNIDANASASEVANQLKAMRDGKYESYADADRNSHLSLMGGLGLRYRLGGHFGLGLEGVLKYPNNDYLDGQAWKTNTELSQNSDLILNGGLLFEYLF